MQVIFIAKSKKMLYQKIIISNRILTPNGIKYWESLGYKAILYNNYWTRV
jgi:hypothetical protein